MKIITKSEAEKLHLKMKKGRSKFLLEAVRDLQPKQILFIDIEEWKEIGLKSSPIQVVMSAIKHPRGILPNNTKINMRAAEEGWMFEKYE